MKPVRTAVIALIIQTISFVVFSQNSDRRFFVDVGWIARTTVFYQKGTDGLSSGPGINTEFAFDYRAGINGTGLNVSLGYRLFEKLDISLQYAATVRYDAIEYDQDCQCHNKTIYIDNSILVTKSFNLLTKVLNRKPYVGIGVTAYNLGKELNVTIDGRDETLELQFNSIDFLFGIPVWKLYVEPKLSLVQNNFPGTIKDNATLLGARIHYRFNFKKKGAL